MSMLTRYKRAGGLQQLISLIEACDPERQKQLLDLIGNEDPGWAVLVHQKALSSEKIFRWPSIVVAEILATLPPKVAAIACRHTSEECATEAIRGLPHRKACEIIELMEELEPTKNELHAAAVRLVRAARDLERMGRIKIQESQSGPEIDDRLIA